jgi:Ca2+-binding EF-hand superfamily protein
MGGCPSCRLTGIGNPGVNGGAMKSILLLSLGLAAVTTSAFAGESRKVSPAKVVVFTNLFNEADTDGNEVLDEEEFAGSYGASERPVITEIRFDSLASFINSFERGKVEIERGILLEDFIEATGGRRITPSKAQTFFAADDNDNGFLSMSEFFATRIQSASSEASAAKAFDKLDKNNDNQISPAEFGISVVPV